jgi:hypothetical protein
MRINVSFVELRSCANVITIGSDRDGDERVGECIILD